ncbi:antibiotic biosynthesis monooxygenase [Cryobacterium melibiosiphilum]|uniref:Antibiotic biosynthesis monooxygenase n=1 Tax=Cryobacterium melibiosiphilum TaxID=995039 RepID=A0A3A5MN48_9MICO|nr:antibiotic biosynthesis monooxygenase [Cryobacterium melibiosiphilum]RJT86994.1 antibiotic biosynthesis monooxygenase [Cryobacterium melibiosiphilum]
MTSQESDRLTPASPSPASASVTVSITRTVDPARFTEASEWVQFGINLAQKYPGFLGSGWVRGSEDSATWNMLYRFSNPDSLEAWENSDERTEWLEAGTDLVLDAHVEKRTGIEGWFDGMQPGEPVLQPPPRWKQSVSIWLGFFPVNLVFTLLVTWLVPGWGDLNTALKVLLTTLVLTPLMAYFVLPWVTRMLRPWLHRQPQ